MSQGGAEPGPAEAFRKASRCLVHDLESSTPFELPDVAGREAGVDRERVCSDHQVVAADGLPCFSSETWMDPYGSAAATG